MATGSRATPPRPGAGVRAATAAQRQAQKEAERKAAEDEAKRLADQEAARAQRASADNLPAADDGTDSEDPNAAPAREPFAELTDAGTGSPLLIDPTAVAHIGPGVGSMVHSDPEKAAKGEHEMGFLTEISTIGGVLLKVLEDVETVASILRV